MSIEKATCRIMYFFTKFCMILDGRIVGREILDRVRQGILSRWKWPTPKLAVVLVGNNPASLIYIRMKQKRAHEVGMLCEVRSFPNNVSQEVLEWEIRLISSENDTHGVIIQAPLPKHLDRYKLIECILPEKDVDGFTKTQIGNMFLEHTWLWSCTPKGIMTLLKYYNIDVGSKKVVVLGRSNIVGKPLALMLINAWATVISCNSNTLDLEKLTQSADIVIVAIGKPHFLNKSMVKKDAVVIDVGSTLLDWKIYGDADFESLKEYVSALSPSPGGVGPMTVATLIDNTWQAYCYQCNIPYQGYL